MNNISIMNYNNFLQQILIKCQKGALHEESCIRINQILNNSFSSLQSASPVDKNLYSITISQCLKLVQLTNLEDFSKHPLVITYVLFLKKFYNDLVFDFLMEDLKFNQDEMVYIYVLANFINSESIPLANLCLPKEDVLKIATFIKNFIFDHVWDENDVGIKMSQTFYTEDFILEILKKAKKIENIYLRNLQITGLCLSQFDFLPYLKKLCIINCPNFDCPLPFMPNLTQFKMTHCEKFNQKLPSMPFVTHFELRENGIFNQSLPKIPNVQECQLSGNYNRYHDINTFKLTLNYDLESLIKDWSSGEKLNETILSLINRLIEEGFEELNIEHFFYLLKHSQPMYKKILVPYFTNKEIGYYIKNYSISDPNDAIKYFTSSQKEIFRSNFKCKYEVFDELFLLKAIKIYKKKTMPQRCYKNTLSIEFVF